MIILCIATILALYIFGVGALMGIYMIGCVTMLMFAFGLGLIILHIIKGIAYDMIEQVADNRLAERQKVIVARPRRRKQKKQIAHTVLYGEAIVINPNQLPAVLDNRGARNY